MTIPPLTPFTLLNPTSLTLDALSPAGARALPQALPEAPFAATLWNLPGSQALEAGLAQLENPIPPADTTLLQAEIEAGTALATGLQAGVIPPHSALFPTPGALPLVTALAELNAELAASQVPNPGLLAEVLALSPATLQLVPAGQTSLAAAGSTLAQAEADLAVATVLQAQDLSPVPMAGATLLQAELATYETTTLPDATAATAYEAALASLGIVYQQAVTNALQAGAANISLLLTGPAAGMAETLAGSGWVQVPSGANAAEAEAVWSFSTPFTARDVPPVAPTLQVSPSGVKEHPEHAEEAPGAYGSHGEQEAAPANPSAHSLDILD